MTLFKFKLKELQLPSVCTYIYIYINICIRRLAKWDMSGGAWRFHPQSLQCLSLVLEGLVWYKVDHHIPLRRTSKALKGEFTDEPLSNVFESTNH